MFSFSKASLDKMNGVDLKLVNLMKEAIKNSPYDFKITEGLRTVERQKELVKTGKSKTMNSYHLKGKAVDIAVLIDNKITWDFKYYKEVANCVKEVARKLGYIITWGGDWKTFKDGPHFQIEN